MSPDKARFAEVLTESYHKIDYILGNPVIYYDTKLGEFGWCSADVPLEEHEIKILVMRKGMFGGICPSVAEVIDDKDLWEYVEITIRYGDKK